MRLLSIPNFAKRTLQLTLLPVLLLLRGLLIVCWLL